MAATMKHLFLPVLLLLGTAFAAEESAPKKPDAPKEVILFDGKTLDDWEMVDVGGSGIVELVDGEMLIHQGEGVSGAVYKKAEKLPTTNYEITLEAKRLQGVDFFVGLTVPVGDLKTCCTFICGGWGGAVTGISSINNFDASENNTSTYQRYEDDKWYRIRLRVTPHNLSAWIGDEQVVDEDIVDKKISVRAGPIESYLPLSLTNFNTTTAIRNIKLTPVAPQK